MISVQEAKEIIKQRVKPLPVKRVALKDAAGLALADDVYAITDIPGFMQSSVDGYAFIFQDNGLPLKVIGEMAAGQQDNFTIHPKQAARIFTGAPLPAGADTVVMQEKTELINGQLIIKDEAINPGNNVRPVGAEIMNGRLAMKKSEMLTPAALGFLAGIGINEASVYAAPVVTLIITGKELQQPGQPLGFGQVYDANSIMLSTVLKNAGVRCLEIMYADDDLNEVTKLLADALLQSDMVLLVGGISVGDYDFVLPATERCGVQQHFHKVKQKPGKPLFFGTKENKIIFGLPGNPSSALTCFYEYVLPAMEIQMEKYDTIKPLKATLANSYSKAKGLTHFLKGSYADGVATLLGAQESFRLTSYAQANCLVVFDEGKENFNAGESIEVHCLPF